MIRIVALLLGLLCLYSCAINLPSETIKAPKLDEKQQLVNIDDSPVADSIPNPLSTILMIEASEAKHLGELSKAISLFNKAIEVDPYNDAAHFELANIYQFREQFDTDLALFNSRRAYEIDPSNRVYQIMLGRLLVDLGQANEGVKIFEQLVASYPKRKDYAFDLAFAYEKAGREQEAIAVFDGIEATYGYDPEINYQKHVLYFKMGDRPSGIAEIEEIVDNNPEYASYSVFVAKYYLEVGALEKAEKYAKLAYQQEEENSEAFEIFALTYIYQDQLGDFDKLLQSVVESDLTVDQKVKQFESQIDFFRRSPRLRATILKNAKQLSEFHADRAEPHALYGDFLYLDDQNDAAIPAYKTSLTIRDDVYEVWAQVIDIYVYEKNYTELAPLASKAIEKFPDIPFPAYMAGYAQFRNGNYGNAIQVLEQALATTYSTSDYDIPMLILLADAYHENRQFDEAYLTYDKVLLQDPDNAHVLNNYSYFLAERKVQLDKAKAMAARALELNPEDANTLDTYGFVLYQSGEYVKAEQVLDRAVLKDPSSAIILEHYGDVLFENQKIDEAMIQWKKAFDLDGSNEGLRNKIQKNQ